MGNIQSGRTGAVLHRARHRFAAVVAALGVADRSVGRELNAEARPTVQLFESIATHKTLKIRVGDGSVGLAATHRSVMNDRFERQT